MSCVQNLRVKQLVFESCHSTWVFDLERNRFRRILKGVEMAQHRVATQWRTYYGLEFEEGSEEFTVQLNPTGTRLVHSWRHTEECAQCGGHMTSELSLEEINALALG